MGLYLGTKENLELTAQTKEINRYVAKKRLENKTKKPLTVYEKMAKIVEDYEDSVHIERKEGPQVPDNEIS